MHGISLTLSSQKTRVSILENIKKLDSGWRVDVNLNQTYLDSN